MAKAKPAEYFKPVKVGEAYSCSSYAVILTAIMGIILIVVIMAIGFGNITTQIADSAGFIIMASAIDPTSHMKSRISGW